MIITVVIRMTTIIVFPYRYKVMMVYFFETLKHIVRPTLVAKEAIVVSTLSEDLLKNYVFKIDKLLQNI